MLPLLYTMRSATSNAHSSLLSEVAMFAFTEGLSAARTVAQSQTNSTKGLLTKATRNPDALLDLLSIILVLI
jgi:pyruvate/2-oxoglutarate/acetoin dehydrogenase E1 component